MEFTRPTMRLNSKDVGSLDSTKIVLHIDDDTNVRKALARFLSFSQFTVHGEGDSGRALQAFRETNPRIVLLDGNMPPGPNGLRVLQTLVDSGVVATRQKIMEIGSIPPGQAAILLNSGGLLEEGASAALMKVLENGNLLGAIPKPPNLDQLETILKGLAENPIQPTTLQLALRASREALAHYFDGTSTDLQKIDAMIASLSEEPLRATG